MQEVVDAKEKQLKNLIENEAFEEVEFFGQASYQYEVDHH